MQFLKKIIKSSSTLVLLDQAVYSGTNFVLTLFLAKQMSINDFGVFSTVVVVTYLALSFMNALLVQPFQVSVTKVLNKRQYYIFLFFGLVLFLFLIVFFTFISTFFIETKTLDFFNIALFIIAYLFQDFFRKLFLGISKIKEVLIIDILFLILVSLGLYFWFHKVTIANSLIIIALSNIFSGAVGLVFITKVFEFPLDWKIFLKDHIKQSKWLMSVSVLQWVSSNFFVLISGAYLGFEALGAFRLVQSFFGILNVVLQTVENYFLPKTASLYYENKTKAKKYLLEITVYGALFFGSILMGLFVFASKVIVIAGGYSYEKYAYAVRIMAVLYFFIFLSYPFRIMIRVLLLNKTFFLGYLISFGVSLGSFHFLLHFFGLSGAITGLIINQIIMLLYWQNQLKKNHFLLWK